TLRLAPRDPADDSPHPRAIDAADERGLKSGSVFRRLPCHLDTAAVHVVKPSTPRAASIARSASAWLWTSPVSDATPLTVSTLNCRADTSLFVNRSALNLVVIQVSSTGCDDSRS